MRDFTDMANPETTRDNALKLPAAARGMHPVRGFTAAATAAYGER
jgi:hypothetical protein